MEHETSIYQNNFKVKMYISICGIKLWNSVKLDLSNSKTLCTRKVFIIINYLIVYTMINQVIQ